MKRRIQGSFSILKRNGNEEIDRFANIGEIQLARRFVFTGVVPKHFPGMTCVTSALQQRRKIYRAICEWRKSMQENSVRVIARVLAYPDAAVQVRAILSALIEPTRNEPGCISYELLQNQINPADFTFIEAWESNAAIDSHLSAKHVSDALTNLAV